MTRGADPAERRVSTVGHIHPHLEARVVDPHTRQTLSRGQVRLRAGLQLAAWAHALAGAVWQVGGKPRSAIIQSLPVMCSVTPPQPALPQLAIVGRCRLGSCVCAGTA
jgi:hypothetical protein